MEGSQSPGIIIPSANNFLPPLKKMGGGNKMPQAPDLTESATTYGKRRAASPGYSDDHYTDEELLGFVIAIPSLREVKAMMAQYSEEKKEHLAQALHKVLKELWEGLPVAVGLGCFTLWFTVFILLAVCLYYYSGGH